MLLSAYKWPDYTTVLQKRYHAYKILFIFRNGQPDRNFDYHHSDFSGIDPTAPIPVYPVLWKYKVTAWYVFSNPNDGLIYQKIFLGG